MNRAFAPLGLGIVALGLGGGCWESEQPGLGDQVDRGAPCEGTCLGKLVVLQPEPIFLNMSVDRDRGFLYGYGSRVDVSNPRAMKVTPLPKIGPTIVDPNSGRYATAVYPGHGDDTSTLYVFGPNGSLWDSQPLPGLAFAMDVDATDGRFFVTTQQSDQVIVYSEASRTLLASRPVGASVMDPIFDPSLGGVFVNQAVGPYAHYQWLILDRNLEAGPSSEGHILATDGARGLVYLAVPPADGSVGNRLEVRAVATGALAGTQIDTDAYWVAPDPVLDRLYVRRLSDVAVFDRTSGAYLASLPFSDGFLVLNIAFAPGDDRIYVVGHERLPNGSATLVLLVLATH